MSRKHILFLCSWYPTRLQPFAGDFVQRHALAASLLNKITVLHATKDKDLQKNYEVQIKEETIKEIIVYYRNSSFRPWNYVRRILAIKMGLKYVDDFDLVHLNVTYPAGVWALFLKLFSGKKYVITEHWTGFREDLFKKVGLIERKIIKIILKNAAKLLPVSADLGKSMQRVAGGKDFEVIPNVIDTDLFVPQMETKNKSSCRFLHLSSLKYEHKNIQGMLNVVKKLSDNGLQFEFHIGGNGSLEGIEKFIAENRLHGIIHTFGALAYDEVPKKMNSSDCFVLFSNYENQPCVQTEAFSCGLPFLGTDVGGISEFLPEKFGLIVPKGDEEALYKAMKEVIEGKEFAEKQEMHQYALDNFSPIVIAQRFDEIYKSI